MIVSVKMEYKIFKSQWTLKFQDNLMDRQLMVQKQECVVTSNTILSSFLLGFSIMSTCFHLTRFHSFDSNNQFEMNKIFTIVSTAIHLINLILSIFLKKNIKLQTVIAFINYFLVPYDNSVFGYFSGLVISESLHKFVSVISCLLEITFRIKFFLRNLLSFKESRVLHLLILLTYTLYSLPVTLAGNYMHVVTFLAVNFFLCFYNYFICKDQMTLFYFSQLAVRENASHKNLIESMNKGIFKLKNSKVVYANKIISETFSKLIRGKKQHSRRYGVLNSDAHLGDKEIENFETYSDFILCKFLMEDSSNISQNQFTESVKLFKNHDTVKSKLESLANEYKSYLLDLKMPNFKPLGIVHLAVDSLSEIMHVDIFYRYFISEDDSECFEFICDDVTQLILIEEKNAEIKYKTLIFSKIAHEIKNPMVGLKELIILVEEILKKLNVNNEAINLNLMASRGLTDYLLMLLKDINYISNYKVLGINGDIKQDDINFEEISDFCKSVAYGLIRKFDKEEMVEFVLNTNISEDVVLKTDEMKLKQILVNLISNSIKFTTNGKVSLNIEHNDDKAIFSVKDTGAGIKEELKNELNQNLMMSAHVKNIEENNRPGIGLGMFIIKNLTQELGSELCLESEANNGTKIWFDLPLTKEDIPLDDTYVKSHNNRVAMYREEYVSSSISISEVDDSQIAIKFENTKYEINLDYIPLTGRKDQSSLSRKNFLGLKSNINDSILFPNQNEEPTFNFLVVDDEKLIRQGTVRMIRKTAETMNISINIIEAKDGIETLYKVYKNVSSGKIIHCIISDESMNYINGIQSAEIINNIYKKSGLKKIQIHIVSAYEFNIDQHDAIQSFETKPLNAMIIRKILTNCKEHFSV